ncbi:MAG: FkbM family methyltransferase [Lentisphaerota bacterium]
MTKEIKKMLYQQTLYNNDDTRTDHPIYSYNANFKPDVHIVLVEMDNHYFYDNYEGYKIAYNVWETTRYPDHFFQRLFYFDEVWVPTQWQYDCLIEQGYPSYKIFIVPEGVDIDLFKPIEKVPPKEKFRFLLLGRWDYRKATTEILKTFGETFKGLEDKVEMICSIENPYPFDGLKGTAERLDFHNIHYDNIKCINFPSRNDYVKLLKKGDVFVSCARSEGWNLPLIESMSCGTPSIFSNWGGQLQFAEGKGIPVKIAGLKPANIERKEFTGEYCEPDFEDLGKQMMMSYENYEQEKIRAMSESKEIHEKFNWDIIAKGACEILERRNKPFVFVTTGNLGYMPVIEKMVQSLLEFSTSKILVYGVDCDVPFDYPNVIKRRIDPPKHSEYDKWYWKQYACIESTNEKYSNFVWIDGDVVANYNIDEVKKYFGQIENYPISDIHLAEDFFGYYEPNVSQLFDELLCEKWGVKRTLPISHVCLYVYNVKCKWWFEEIIKEYKSVDLKEYKKYFLWNDEGIDNALRWKYGFTKHLPVSHFDTSGDDGYGLNTLHHFYKYWNEDGPQNFNKIFGWQYIPKDKSNILYFHGNKNSEVSSKMIEFIKMKKNDLFYDSEYFYTGKYDLENLGDIKNVEGSTWDIAQKYGWSRAIYHEIYNLQEYYKNRERKIFDGDIVVDLGANTGVFNRWAFNQGASKVISFEPDKRYYELLTLNADPRSVLFNAAISDKIGEIEIYESPHLGGSSTFKFDDYLNKYKVRTYTLNYLFESELIDRIDFLKIDIEGSEILALEGISDENLRKVRAISMEYHHACLKFDTNVRHNFITRLNSVGFNSFLVFLGNDDALQLIYFTRN